MTPPTLTAAAPAAAGGKKKGPSRTIVYSLVALVVGVAYFYLTTPQDTTASHRSNRRAHVETAAVPDNDTPEDIAAQYARYGGGRRDPFVPGVTLALPGGGDASAQRAAAKAAAPTFKGQWSLTGITTIDGVTSALVQDGRSGASVFLHPGQHWQGYQVRAITSSAVILANPGGLQAKLTFSDPSQAAKSGAGRAAPGGGGGVPSLGQVTALPALSFDAGGGERRGRGRSFSFTNPADAATQADNANDPGGPPDGGGDGPPPPPGQ